LEVKQSPDMANFSRFTKTTRFNVPVQSLFKWHSMPGAISRLSPPWDPLHIIASDRGIQVGAKVLMKMKAGPFGFTWRAKHMEYRENQMFKDVQVKGPFSMWEHTHRFVPDGEHACFLEDIIDYRLPFYPLSHWLFNRALQKKLERIFAWRHRTTARDLADHVSSVPQAPLNILVSGAGGVIGSALIPYLTTAGHRVVRLVRTGAGIAENEVFWDPYAGILRVEDLGTIDAVIHLSGDNIGEGRWTAKKKKKILESRTVTTQFLTQTLLKLNPRPKVFVCASAVGYYGHHEDHLFTEDDPPGKDFISHVCVEWEKCAAPARENGIRLALLRIGVVLTPAGGALARLLLAHRLGGGVKKIGKGNQFISWVGIDDVLGAIRHVLVQSSIEGPVNLVSPCPATNLEFNKTLAKALGRPAWVAVPAPLVNLIFGQMGREILLLGTRVKPKKLLAGGYRFRHPDLEGALRHVLGKTIEKQEKR
jgi:uncharacterized protein